MLEPIKPQDIKQEQTEDQRIFIVVPFRAIKDKRFTIQRMRALLTVCSYANHKGNLWPSVSKLAEDMGITQPTMQSHIRWLTENGYLMTINNSYTVGKHAKPRAIIYDPNNPPNPDDWCQASQDIEQVEQEQKTIQEQTDRLVQSIESKEEVLAKPTSLYQVWRKLLLSKFGTDIPYQKEIWAKLSAAYTLSEFQRAATLLIESKTAPPASPNIMLRR